MYIFNEVIFYITIVVVCNLLCVIAFFKQKEMDSYIETRFDGVVESGKYSEFYDDIPTKIITNKVIKKTYFDHILKILFSFDRNSEICSGDEFKRFSLFSFIFFFLIFIFCISYIPFNFTVVFIFSALWIVFIRFHFVRKVNKFRKNLVEQLPDTVFMMARSLKIGVSLSRTLELIARQSPEPTKALFEDVVKKISVGKELGEVLDELAIKSGMNEYRFFSIITKLQNKTGGGLADILNEFGKNIRKRISARKKAIALASEARMSCYVLSALPIFMAVVLSIMNPQYVSVLYRTDSGLKLLYVAMVLFFSGISSMFLVTKLTLR
ncbi:Flp pilus assembly protein TadB [Acetobacter aceti NBRC 14818]|nr:type II secretion system F family protein [Acetobacter aceti]TCS34832.1 Flp pilus assembly protein TadB [Acetobacter aceti NBRC 14818]GAN56099.1 secretion system type II protein [Acetobacter aceti NBRC 14818]